MSKILEVKDKLNIQYQVKADSPNVNVKELDLNKREVDVIANTYNYFDSDQDVLLNGCCSKSIQERGPQSNLPGKIKHLANHDLKKGVGVPRKIEETKYNNMDVLRAVSYMSESEDGEDYLIKYQEGMIDQHSIGFRYIQIELIEKEAEGWDDILKILINPDDAIATGYLYAVKEIALREFSTLDGFGANRLTPYLGSKSANKNIQYQNLIGKLNALHKTMKSGAKDKYALELEEQQVKQMIYEIYHPEPSMKDTLKPSNNDTKGINYGSLIQNVNINN